MHRNAHVAQEKFLSPSLLFHAQLGLLESCEHSPNPVESGVISMKVIR